MYIRKESKSEQRLEKVNQSNIRLIHRYLAHANHTVITRGGGGGAAVRRNLSRTSLYTKPVQSLHRQCEICKTRTYRKAQDVPVMGVRLLMSANAVTIIFSLILAYS